MAKFNFKLKSIKNFKSRIEEDKGTKFGRIQQKVKHQHDKLQNIYDHAYKSGDRLNEKLDGGMSPGEIAVFDDFRRGQGVRAKDQQEEIENSINDMIYAFREWMDAKKKLSIFEKLEEKSFNVFKKEMKKKEQKSLDELVVLRHKIKL